MRTRGRTTRREPVGVARLARSGEAGFLSHDSLTEETVDAAGPYMLDGLCRVFYKDRIDNGRDYRDAAC